MPVGHNPRAVRVSFNDCVGRFHILIWLMHHCAARFTRKSFFQILHGLFSFLAAAALGVALVFSAKAQSSFPEELKASSFKIAYETYVNSNWEIFVMNADG